jgi:hypothetical protein
MIKVNIINMNLGMKVLRNDTIVIRPITRQSSMEKPIKLPG